MSKTTVKDRDSSQAVLIGPGEICAPNEPRSANESIDWAEKFQPLTCVMTSEMESQGRVATRGQAPCSGKSGSNGGRQQPNRQPTCCIR